MLLLQARRNHCQMCRGFNTIPKGVLIPHSRKPPKQSDEKLNAEIETFSIAMAKEITIWYPRYT